MGGLDMQNIKQLVDEHKDLLVNTRRDLHRIPETAFSETKTSSYVADFLTREGLQVRTGLAEFGVVGLMDTGRPGPTLMIRADMDALPLKEETGLAFSSTHKGSMHACGHDAHMAMCLVAVKLFEQIKEKLCGKIKFLFQPAEEGPGGAKPMIEAGVMETPGVDYAVGCHMWPDIPEGTIGVRAGAFMAAMDRFDIKITGRGGHGAMPHLSVDALEVGCQVVSALQRIVSRHLNPLAPAVVTVGSFQAGTAFNIIPGEAKLSGTTRTFDVGLWDSWKERIEKVVKGVCESMDAGYELTYSSGYPPTINDETVAEVVRRSAAGTVGPEKVVEPPQTMGGEDFSFYLQRAKGCFFALGVGRENGFSVHHPKFDFNEDVMALGVETYARIAFDLLKNA